MARGLTDTERGEAQIVFHGALDYTRVLVVENVSWPNWIGQLGAKLQGQQLHTDNAVTLGNRVNFPVELHTSLDHIQSGDLTHMAWLVHELTHVLQYQRVGIIYLAQALWGQVRHGSQVYKYGGKQGLLEARSKGLGAESFNREQQGNLARDYYTLFKQGGDTSAWEPFVAELRAGRL